MHAPDHLRKYVRQCRLLAADLDAAIQDLQLEQRKGPIWRAVDFSEIYAYVLPLESAAADDVLGEAPIATAVALQEGALRRVFHPRGEGPFLLPPFALELEHFVQRMRQGAFESALKTLPAALDQLAGLDPRRPEMSALREALETAGQADAALSVAAEEALLTLLERYAPALLAMALDADLQPLQRLTELLSPLSFRSIEEAVGATIEPDATTQSRWFHSLNLARPQSGSSNFVDATAMAILWSAARVLPPSIQALQLVTRSAVMHDIFRREKETSWSNLHVSLRHPRSFTALHYIQHLSSADQISALKYRLRSLALFLRSVHSLETEGRLALLSVQDEPPLTAPLQRVKEEWLGLGNLSGVLERSSRLHSGLQPAVRFVLEVLSKPNEARRVVETRIHRLTEALERSHQLLGVLLQTLVPEGSQRLDAGFTLEAGEDFSVLWSRSASMPYRLRFRADEVARMASAVEAEEAISLDTLLVVFDRTVGDGPKLEWLLFLAYVLGLVGNWQLAEQYCDLALKGTDAMRDEAARECLFFLAICKRKSCQSSLRFAEAIRLLDRLIIESRSTETQCSDPRFLNERAAQVFFWRRFLVAPSDVAEPPPPPLAEAVDHSLRALQCATDDRLRIHILNNLCYWYLEANDLRAAKEHYSDLCDMLGRHGGGPLDWHPHIMDTVYWIRWRTEGVSIPQDARAAMLRDYESALSRRDLLEEEKALICEHAAAIRENRSAGAWPPSQ